MENKKNMDFKKIINDHMIKKFNNNEKIKEIKNINDQDLKKLEDNRIYKSFFLV